MSKKINLALLNKKKEEIDRKEMHEVRGGISNCQCDPSAYNETGTGVFMDKIESCACASIWVTFGLS